MGQLTMQARETTNNDHPETYTWPSSSPAASRGTSGAVLAAAVIVPVLVVVGLGPASGVTGAAQIERRCSLIRCASVDPGNKPRR